VNEVLDQIRRYGNPYACSFPGFTDARWKCDLEDCAACSSFCGSWPTRTAGHHESETKRCCKGYNDLHGPKRLDRRATLPLARRQCIGPPSTRPASALPGRSDLARCHEADALLLDRAAWSVVPARRAPERDRRYRSATSVRGGPPRQAPLAAESVHLGGLCRCVAPAP
jgi:hypothetical protein